MQMYEIGGERFGVKVYSGVTGNHRANLLGHYFLAAEGSREWHAVNGAKGVCETAEEARRKIIEAWGSR